MNATAEIGQLEIVFNAEIRYLISIGGAGKRKALPCDIEGETVLLEVGDVKVG